MNSTAIKCAVFDCDGTILNTITDLGNACDFLIGKYGFCAKWSEDDYKQFVGNGMKKLVERAFKHTLSESELEERLKEFKAYYNEHMLDNTRPYDGIAEQLKILKDKGIKLCVVTNKAEPEAIRIIEMLFGKGTFDVIIGQRDNMPVKPDPTGVFEALKEVGCTAEESLYFGDSNVDIKTAENAKIKAVGVTWGFRSYEELSARSPFKIIDKTEDISKLF